VRFALQSAFTAVFLVVVNVAFAGPFEDGQAAYQRYDYATALRFWRPLADHGDSNTQYKLGNMYAQGEGVTLDRVEAVKWFRKAADHGFAPAQFELSALYVVGQGVAQDYAEAATLCRKAAEQGLAVAQAMLGSLYANGQGVPQDYVEAAKWYRKAADQGLDNAQSDLGLMFVNGQGVAQDYVEAVKWYRRAADQGYAPAQCSLGIMYAIGHGVPQDYIRAHMWLNLAAAHGIQDANTVRDLIVGHMSSDQLAEAQRLAREWKPTDAAIAGRTEVARDASQARDIGTASQVRQPTVDRENANAVGADPAIIAARTPEASTPRDCSANELCEISKDSPHMSEAEWRSHHYPSSEPVLTNREVDALFGVLPPPPMRSPPMQNTFRPPGAACLMAPTPDCFE